MQLIDCPWCGPREEVEFHYGGQAHVSYPEDPSALSDDELAAVYTGAQALVFPSDDEGFGLPPVEALACGTPVAASDIPALREVLDGRAILRPVDDLPGLRAAAEAAERPAAPPSAWTWEDAAEQTWEIYEQAASLSRPVAVREPQRVGLSTRTVTGPSLTSSTSIIAPNTPRLASSRSQKRS